MYYVSERFREIKAGKVNGEYWVERGKVAAGARRAGKASLRSDVCAKA